MGPWRRARGLREKIARVARAVERRLARQFGAMEACASLTDCGHAPSFSPANWECVGPMEEGGPEGRAIRNRPARLDVRERRLLCPSRATCSVGRRRDASRRHLPLVCRAPDRSGLFVLFAGSVEAGHTNQLNPPRPCGGHARFNRSPMRCVSGGSRGCKSIECRPSSGHLLVDRSLAKHSASLVTASRWCRRHRLD
jgi:hypothetical protein